MPFFAPGKKIQEAVSALTQIAPVRNAAASAGKSHAPRFKSAPLESGQQTAGLPDTRPSAVDRGPASH